MQKLDKDALVCDFASEYHIYDYRGLPARYAAVLACGLRANSRIRMKQEGIDDTIPDLLMQAQILDVLRMTVWAMGGKSKDQPQLVSDLMMGQTPADKKKAMARS